MQHGCLSAFLVPLILISYVATARLSVPDEPPPRKIFGMSIVEHDRTASMKQKRDDPIDICRACPTGSYSPAGNLKCSDCRPGWCPNVTYCILCPEGFFSNSTNSTRCDECSDGFVAKFKNTTKCSPCGAGFTSSSPHRHCEACIPGTSNPKTGSTCSPCPRGQFQSNYGGFNCSLCQAASWNDQLGQASCVNCGQGHWGVTIGATTPDTCSDCPEGYYCPQPRTIKPLPCPSDHYCEKGSAGPSSCPFLFQSPSISTTCRPSTYFYLIFAGLGGLVLVFAVVVWITVSRYRSKKKKKTRPSKGRSETENLIPAPLPGPVYNGL